jgi:hypothetical protein
VRSVACVYVSDENEERSEAKGMRYSEGRKVRVVNTNKLIRSRSRTKKRVGVRGDRMKRGESTKKKNRCFIFIIAIFDVRMPESNV